MTTDELDALRLEVDQRWGCIRCRRLLDEVDRLNDALREISEKDNYDTVIAGSIADRALGLTKMAAAVQTVKRLLHLLVCPKNGWLGEYKCCHRCQKPATRVLLGFLPCPCIATGDFG